MLINDTKILKQVKVTCIKSFSVKKNNTVKEYKKGNTYNCNILSSFLMTNILVFTDGEYPLATEMNSTFFNEFFRITDDWRV